MEQLKTQLVDRLNSDNESERLYAVTDIQETDDDKLTGLLISRLAIETDPAVKDALIYALKSMEDEMNYDALFDFFSSNKAFLRNAAVSIMSSYNMSIVPYLLNKLSHNDKDVRKLILDTLVNVDDEGAIAAIRTCLNDSSINVVISAVEYLTRLGYLDCAKMLIDLFVDNDEPLLRIAIIEAMIEFRVPEFYKPAMEILAYKGNFEDIDSVFKPQILKLIAAFGCMNEIIEALHTISNIETYAEEILYLYSNGIKRFGESFINDCSTDMLIEIENKESVRIEARLNALHIIGTCYKDAGIETINEIIVTTKNHDIRQFAMEMLNERL